MNVLLAAPYGGVPGGISRWTGHIMKYYLSLHEKPCELTLLQMDRSSFVNINSSLLHRVKTAFKDYRKILSSFRTLLKIKNFDIMHLTSSASISLMKDLYMISQCKRRNIKSVVHFRFGRIPELASKKNWEWKLLVKVVEMADKVIVIDEKSFNSLHEEGWEHVALLPNPLAPEVLGIVENNMNLKHEKNLVLFAGHVVRTKGVFELISACSAINGVTLKIVGHVEDEISRQLYELAKCRLEVVGELSYEDVIKEMLRCDVFALPTYTEGFPNVILESMAAGCAIVTTSVGAIPQMLERDGDKQYGILVEPRNTGLLKAALEKMLVDVKLKEECRKNVRERATERYSIASIWQQMVQIWQDVDKQ